MIIFISIHVIENFILLFFFKAQYVHCNYVLDVHSLYIHQLMESGMSFFSTLVKREVMSIDEEEQVSPK